jgi:hypothetical protein
LSHPSQALRRFVSLLFKVYGLLGVVQLESLSSLLIIPLTVYQHTVNIGIPFFKTNPVNSKPDLLATSQSFTYQTNQTKQSDENRRQIINTSIWLRRDWGFGFSSAQQPRTVPSSLPCVEASADCELLDFDKDLGDPGL